MRKPYQIESQRAAMRIEAWPTMEIRGADDAAHGRDGRLDSAAWLLPAQKYSFNPNCTCRGEFDCEVTLPNAEDPTVTFGPLNCGWLTR
jgi:hypothetical protein